MPNLKVKLVKGIFGGLPSYYEAASEILNTGPYIKPPTSVGEVPMYIASIGSNYGLLAGDVIKEYYSTGLDKTRANDLYESFANSVKDSWPLIYSLRPPSVISALVRTGSALSGAMKELGLDDPVDVTEIKELGQVVAAHTLGHGLRLLGYDIGPYTTAQVTVACFLADMRNVISINDEGKVTVHWDYEDIPPNQRFLAAASSASRSVIFYVAEYMGLVTGMIHYNALKETK